MSVVTRAGSLLIACSIFTGCESRPDSPPHSIVGVWNPVLDPAVPPPTTDEAWRELLEGEEPSYAQMIFLSDGTLVLGGLMLGHELAEESRWEILEETPEWMRLRTTDANGRIDEMTITVEGPDLLRTGPEPPRMQLYRAQGIGPFPWLAKYEDRL